MSHRSNRWWDCPCRGCQRRRAEAQGGGSKNAGRILSRDSLKSRSAHEWNSAEIHYGTPYRMSLYELAELRGGRITIHVKCWHCPAMIFLHATAQGGFRAFDQLGGDWPQHECDGFKKNPNYYRTKSLEWAAEFDVPAGEGARPGDPDELTLGSSFSAVIVWTKSLPDFDRGVAFWPAVLSTGRELFHLWLDQPTESGVFVTGRIRKGRAGRKCLTNIRPITPPDKMLQ
jgi:hypothetical protein